MFSDPEVAQRYSTLAVYSSPMPRPERAIVGRDHEIDRLMASMLRPELRNPLLLGPAGSGKTAVVQGAMMADVERHYREVDLARMIAALSSSDQLAGMLKQLFDEAQTFGAVEEVELVLFIDEFHQIVQLSPAAVEAIKPVLALSGQRGLRIIAATTFEEFHQHIAPNSALVQRLQRINLSPTDRSTTVTILKAMAERYGVADQFYDDHLFELIYEYTERYMRSATQPRKSILLLDAMVGWHRLQGRQFNRRLLAEVLEDSSGINVAFRVDATTIKSQLDAKVISQQFATSAVANRLQICVADLHDKTKPQASFLFAGSTGTGKTELTKQLAKLIFGDDEDHFIRFDMSEYALESSMGRFRSELTRQMWNMGHAVLLLDEVEKAHSVVIRILLQVLDDGRLSDDHGRQVSFLNSYIVMTTNAASEIFSTIAQYNADDTGSGRELADKMKEIRRSITSTQGDNRFPPELLGRIDAIVPFQPLSRSTKEAIVRKKLLELVQDVLAKHGIRVKPDTKVLTYLVQDHEDSDSDAGGARAAISKMNEEVTTKVATFVNAYPNEKFVRISVEGTMRSEDKNQRRSGAWIAVSALR